MTMAEKRVVLISGGTYGIGRATTLKFARQGYAVTAFGVDEQQSAGTRSLAQEQGYDVTVLTADVADPAAARAVVEDVLRREGQIDVLVNNAAIQAYGTIQDTSEEVWDRTFAVNIRGMFLLTKAVLPHMIARRRGAIVNTASGSGYGRPGRIAYCASKGAVFAFSNALAVDHAKDGIRVNTVVPGTVFPTGMNENRAAEMRGMLERAKTASPAGRPNTPEDIANAIAWLASEEAATITGSTLEVMIR
jgi:NAD(P)-dependent dehydrogenase (short-subunit alcohol dehydrogenase family)